MSLRSFAPRETSHSSSHGTNHATSHGPSLGTSHTVVPWFSLWGVPWVVPWYQNPMGQPMGWMAHGASHEYPGNLVHIGRCDCCSGGPAHLSRWWLLASQAADDTAQISGCLVRFREHGAGWTNSPKFYLVCIFFPK